MPISDGTTCRRGWHQSSAGLRYIIIVMIFICLALQYTSADHSNSSIFVSNVQHFISQREEFETARDGILVWLTEMDLQLTNIEHFSECDIQAKIKQLRVGLSQCFRPIEHQIYILYVCVYS